MKRLLIVAMSGLALTGCLHDFRNDPPEQHQIFKDRPNGQGDPQAISCYRPLSSASRFSGLECRPNSDWAQISASEKRNGPVDIGNKAGGAPVTVAH